MVVSVFLESVVSITSDGRLREILRVAELFCNCLLKNFLHLSLKQLGLVTVKDDLVQNPTGNSFLLRLAQTSLQLFRLQT